MNAPRLELRIRRLELHSAVRPSRAALCAAVERELATLLGQSAGRAGRPASPTDARLTTNACLTNDARLTALARPIANALHEALCAERRSAVPARAGDGSS